MNSTAKIFVAGHRGMVGSAIERALRARGHHNILTRSRAQTDLLEQAAVRALFEQERPEYVFLAAARVGGILANNVQRADFIYENLTIQTHVIHEAWRAGVKRLLFLGSSCIYPKLAPQPMQEAHLLTGALEQTNQPYALAKIAGLEMCDAYQRQHGADFRAAMPTNLYGPGDNFDLQNSHVIPALIRKIHDAKAAGAAQVPIWGTGTPRREFLHVDDLADACVYLMSLERPEWDRTIGGPFVNVGCGQDLSIAELATLIAQVVGYKGRFAFDPTKPDGTPRKLLDVSRLKAGGWKPKVGLREGLDEAYRWYLAHASDVRGG